MKTKTFVVGAIILSLGLVLFFYGYSNIQAIGSIEDWSYPYRDWYLQERHTATIYESVGIGLIAMGALITTYSILAKEKSARS